MFPIPHRPHPSANGAGSHPDEPEHRTLQPVRRALFSIPGTDLSGENADWQADHTTDWAKGGRTAIFNGEAQAVRAGPEAAEDPWLVGHIWFTPSPTPLPTGRRAPAGDRVSPNCAHAARSVTNAT